MPGNEAEEYEKGFADGRRTVEAEVAAERHALAVLANALGDAVADATLHLHPCDLDQLDLDALAISVSADPCLRPGSVRLTGFAT